MSELRSTRSALLMSILALLLCFVMLLGTTFAWFTDSVTSSGNKISSGTLKIDLELLEKDGTWNSIKESNAPIFDYEKWEPGYTDVKILKVENEGTIALKWMAKFISEDELSELANVIDVYVCPSASELAYPTDGSLAGYVKVGTVADFVNTIENTTTGVLSAGEVAYLGIALKMDGASVGNDYQGLDLCGAFDITILATQLAGEYPSSVDTWDGTADISWYDPDKTEYSLTSAEALAGLAALVDGSIPVTYSTEGLELPVTFEGKTIKLDCDVDLYCLDEDGGRVCFDPIGDASSADFSGVFDGNGKTIYNLYQDCNSKHLGLFGAVFGGTVKNLTLDGANVENNGNGYASAFVAYAGDATFENLTLRNSTVVNYNHNTGGIVGWCSNNGTTTTFDGITIESSVTVGSWWGSYDTRVGGIIGAMNTGNYVVIKNSTVACRLDVYNDITANYQWGNYRMAGMLVGDVRDTQEVDGRTEAYPVRVTCENVKVIFGDWANYHYCEDSDYGTPSYADEGEYKYLRVEAGLGYGGVDLSECDHAEDESHNELVTFDCLFGARDGKGIYSISTGEGVTVILPGNN